MTLACVKLTNNNSNRTAHLGFHLTQPIPQALAPSFAMFYKLNEECIENSLSWKIPQGSCQSSLPQFFPKLSPKVGCKPTLPLLTSGHFLPEPCSPLWHLNLPSQVQIQENSPRGLLVSLSWPESISSSSLPRLCASILWSWLKGQTKKGATD